MIGRTRHRIRAFYAATAASRKEGLRRDVIVMSDWRAATGALPFAATAFLKERGLNMTAAGSADTSAVTLPTTRPTRSRLLGLPIVADFAALLRFFRDADASVAGKAFVLLAVAYVIWPVDAVPDVAPVLGWLDDLGVAALALGYVAKVVKRYRAA